MNRNKQISRLLVFAEVAKQGSFTKAGKELGISKSAVSQQIQILESELDIELLHRTTRGLGLTTVGEKLYQRSKIIKDQADQVFTDAINASESPTGAFKVTYPHALEQNSIIPAIAQLCQEYPGIEPKLSVSDHALDLVSNNLDLAIHAGELPDSGYRALPLGTLTEVFCATPAFIRRMNCDEKTLTMAQLSELPWIATSWQGQYVDITDRKTSDIKNVRLNQKAKTNTLPSAVQLALTDLGIVLLPCLYAYSFFRDCSLVRIAPTLTGPSWPIYAVHAYQSTKPVHVTRFYQLLCRLIESHRM